jgi:hypothetical protein
VASGWGFKNGSLASSNGEGDLFKGEANEQISLFHSVSFVRRK